MSARGWFITVGVFLAAEGVSLFVSWRLRYWTRRAKESDARLAALIDGSIAP